MRKALVFAVLAIALLIVGVVPVNASGPIRLYVNGQEVYSDVAPQIIEGRTLVPLRVITEALGANVKWDHENNSVFVVGYSSKEFEEFSALYQRDPNLAKAILALGKLFEEDPSLIGVVTDIINMRYNKAASPQPPQQYVPSPQYVPQQTPTSPFYTPQPVNKAWVQVQREQIRSTANARREQIRAEAEKARAQMENSYQIAKRQLDEKKQRDLGALKEGLNARGILQSGIAEAQIQELINYYDKYYQQIEETKNKGLETIRTWEMNNLQEIDKWEQQALQVLQ